MKLNPIIQRIGVMKIKLIIALSILLLTPTGYADTTYLNENLSANFVDIKDVNRQSEAWGVCAAIFKITASFFPEGDAQKTQLLDFSRGAEVAVIMSHVSDGLAEDTSSEGFDSLWNFSKQLGISIPEARLTAILADEQRLGEKGQDQYINKLSTTMKVCSDNLKGQQMYIDIYRELAKKGLLATPN
jgi:hypothetical protein